MLDAATEKRIEVIEERLDEIERILEILLEEQEEAEDAIHGEAAQSNVGRDK